MARRFRVLAVDDDPRGLLALVTLLRSHDYVVDSAASGPEALEVMERAEYDIVISDERMPGMTGSELLAIVRIKHPQAMRIVLTASASLVSTIRSINEGAVFRYLTKPCPHDLMLATVAEAIRTKLRESLHAKLIDHALIQSRLLVEAGQMPSPGAHNGIGQVSISGFGPEDLGRLSSREREVLEMLAAGRRVVDIAKTLFISNHTVRNHLKAIFRKLHVHSQSEIVRRMRG
jgi:DNA-binding NarL/FixJ family response regulator